MIYRSLGRTNIQVSEIGFGAWGIGGAHNGAIAYGVTDDRESRKALKKAFDLGITFYDTADLYGYGHSETLLGQEFKDVRNHVIISSKVGHLNHTGVQNFSVGYIAASIDRSLQRLQTDYIDLYQLHDPPMSVLEDKAILEYLRLLKTQGKIRILGISVRSPEEALVAINRYGFEAVQVNLNMLDQRAVEVGVLDLCKKECVGFIARTPLCFGFLTGQYSAGTDFDGSDHRKNWSHQQKECWANAPQLFQVDSGGGRQTEAQLALRFCLSFPAVSSVIPGMLSEQEVEENVRASQLGALSEVELNRVQRIYKENTFFLGKSDVSRT